MRNIYMYSAGKEKRKVSHLTTTLISLGVVCWVYLHMSTVWEFFLSNCKWVEIHCNMYACIHTCIRRLTLDHPDHSRPEALNLEGTLPYDVFVSPCRLLTVITPATLLPMLLAPRPHPSPAMAAWARPTAQHRRDHRKGKINTCTKNNFIA